MKANRILEWSSTDGSKKSLVVVEDEEKNKDDIDKRQLEVCRFNPETSKWETDEKIDYIKTIDDFGIPDEFIN